MHDKKKQKGIMEDLRSGWISRQELNSKHKLSKNQLRRFIDSLGSKHLVVHEKGKGKEKFFKLEDFVESTTIENFRDLGTNATKQTRERGYGLLIREEFKKRDWLINESLNPASFYSYITKPRLNLEESLVLEGVFRQFSNHQLRLSLNVDLDLKKVASKLKQLKFEYINLNKTPRYIGNFQRYSIFIFKNKVVINGLKGSKRVSLQNCHTVFRQLYLRLTGKRISDYSSRISYYEARALVNEFPEEDILNLLNFLKEQYHGSFTRDSFRFFYSVPFSVDGALLIKYYTYKQDRVLEVISDIKDHSLPVHADRCLEWLFTTLDFIFHAKIPKIESVEEIREFLMNRLKLSADETTVLLSIFTMYLNRKRTFLKTLLYYTDYDKEDLITTLSSLNDKKMLYSSNEPYWIAPQTKTILLNLYDQLKEKNNDELEEFSLQN